MPLCQPLQVRVTQFHVCPPVGAHSHSRVRGGGRIPPWHVVAFSEKTSLLRFQKRPPCGYYTQLLTCLCPHKFWIIKVERIISQVLNSAQHRRDVLLIGAMKIGDTRIGAQTAKSNLSIICCGATYLGYINRIR